MWGRLFFCSCRDDSLEKRRRAVERDICHPRLEWTCMQAMWPGYRLSNPGQGRLQPPREAVLVNEFAPANAMVGIADKSAPTRRGDLRPYRRSGFIRETKAGVPTFSFPSSHRSAV